MKSLIKYETARLSVKDWGPVLNEPSKRSKLENALKIMLTPNVIYHLPLSMQFSKNRDSISKWVNERADEARILCVHTLDTATLVGLIILAEDPETKGIPVYHLGYFLGESAWGKGYASEMVSALVSAIDTRQPIRLIAGVDRDNIASVKVLEKAGFQKLPEDSVSDQHFFTLNVN